MKDLGYPLAKTALASLQQRAQQLPFEIQQLIMQNPELLQMLEQVATGEAEIEPVMEGIKNDVSK